MERQDGAQRALEQLILSSQTQPNGQEVQAEPIPDPPLSIADAEELERRLGPYVAAFEELATQFGYDTATLFTAVFACRGDIEDARAFLLHDYGRMKRPPVPRHLLSQALLSGSW